MSSQAKEINARLERVVNRLINLEKRSVFEHNGVKLHPSEMHLLLAVAGNPEIKPTNLAKVLGVTKGAISQTMARLEKKSMIERRRSGEQAREVSLHFTEAGQAALTGFRAKRAGANAEFNSWLEGLSKAEAATVKEFLAKLAANLAGLE